MFVLSFCILLIPAFECSYFLAKRVKGWATVRTPAGSLSVTLSVVGGALFWKPGQHTGGRL